MANTSIQVKDNNCGFYYTNGQALTVGVNGAYEQLTGLNSDELLGRHMRELVEHHYFDRSVSLMVLESKSSVSITQHVLRTGQKILVTGNPIFDQDGNIMLIVTTVSPLEKNNKGKTSNLKPVNHLIEVPEIGSVIAESEAMKQALDRAMRAAFSNATVLIQGDSGVGKEVMARVVHEYSPRKNKPFVVVNAAAIPGELFEAEMFGYRAGAFTGARREGQTGLVKSADGGTLFLDEISEVPLAAQVKLLRLIQNKELYQLGSSQPQKVDVRIVAASNQDLNRLVSEGKFRRDLYYRLNVVPIHIPPLAKRKADILPMVHYFFNLYCSRYQVQKVLSPDALQELLQYSWPGNVRELQNMIERVVVLSTEETIDAYMVTSELVEADEHVPALYSLPHGTEEDLVTAVEDFEKALIQGALDKYPTYEEAAQALGIHRSTLARKMKKYFS